ncbi:hypothetical protein V8C42DRAFT_338069 [Trichoderma barbatum]
MRFSAIKISAVMLSSFTQGRVLESRAASIAVYPSKCTPGTYYCSAASSPTMADSIMVCNQHNTLVLSAKCGRRGCCKSGPNGLPYCYC